MSQENILVLIAVLGAVTLLVICIASCVAGHYVSRRKKIDDQTSSFPALGFYACAVMMAAMIGLFYQVVPNILLGTPFDSRTSFAIMSILSFVLGMLIATPIANRILASDANVLASVGDE